MPTLLGNKSGGKLFISFLDLSVIQDMTGVVSLFEVR